MNESMMKYIRQRLTDWARSAVVWAMVWVVSIFGLLIVELLNRRSYDSFLIWTMVHHQWLWTTVLLIFLWNAFWICLRNRASAGVRWGNGLLVFLSLVNYYKVEFRQEPFELTDLTQAREGVGILSKLDLKFPPLVLVSLAAALILLPLFLPRKKRAHGLARWLQPGKTIVFLGSSGVGKSGLVNALAGEELMAVGSIREGDGRGRHTTTHRQMLCLPSGVLIIDTPGMRALGMAEASEGLTASFADVEQYLGRCRFSDCSHTQEPGCAVKAAIAAGAMDPARWERYRKLRTEAQSHEEALRRKKEWSKNVALSRKARGAKK